MANNISYVLLILLVASLAKTDAFPENSMRKYFVLNQADIR